MSEKLIKAMEAELRVVSMVNVGALVEAMDDTDIFNMITAMDLSRQDCDFTMDIIRMLVKSLRVDIDHTEMKEFLKELKQISKVIDNQKFGESIANV